MNDPDWSLEIVPSHADRIDLLVGLVEEIFITMIPNTKVEEVIDVLPRIQAAGFQPVPHLAARAFADARKLKYFCDALRDHGIRKVLVIGGGLRERQSPYGNSMQVLQDEAFQNADLTTVALAGHPEGNPVDPAPRHSLAQKLSFLREQGKAAEIVTQWGFSPEKFNAYLKQLHAGEPDIPVRFGVPGPASLKTLLKYAKICGVAASATVLQKQGFSLGRLLLGHDPAKFVKQIDNSHSFHLYPFGGLEKSAAWLKKQQIKSGSRDPLKHMNA